MGKKQRETSESQSGLQGNRHVSVCQVARPDLSAALGRDAATLLPEGVLVYSDSILVGEDGGRRFADIPDVVAWRPRPAGRHPGGNV